MTDNALSMLLNRYPNDVENNSLNIKFLLSSKFLLAALIVEEINRGVLKGLFSINECCSK